MCKPQFNWLKMYNTSCLPMIILCFVVGWHTSYVVFQTGDVIFTLLVVACVLDYVKNSDKNYISCCFNYWFKRTTPRALDVYDCMHHSRQICVQSFFIFKTPLNWTMSFGDIDWRKKSQSNWPSIACCAYNWKH